MMYAVAVPWDGWTRAFFLKMPLLLSNFRRLRMLQTIVPAQIDFTNVGKNKTYRSSSSLSYIFLAGAFLHAFDLLKPTQSLLFNALFAVNILRTVYTAFHSFVICDQFHHESAKILYEEFYSQTLPERQQHLTLKLFMVWPRSCASQDESVVECGFCLS